MTIRELTLARIGELGKKARWKLAIKPGEWRDYVEPPRPRIVELLRKGEHDDPGCKDHVSRHRLIIVSE